MPFMVSDSELEFSKRHKENFYLYRVYNYNSKGENIKFYTIKGDLTKNLSLVPQSFVVKGLL